MRGNDVPAKRGRPAKDTSVNMPASTPSSVNNEVRISNLTTSHFLGTKERSWMRPGTIPQNSSYTSRPVANTTSVRVQRPSAVPDSHTLGHNIQSPREIPDPSQDSIVSEVEAGTSGETRAQTTNATGRTSTTDGVEVVDLTSNPQQDTAIQEPHHQPPLLQIVPSHEADATEHIGMREPEHPVDSVSLSVATIAGVIRQNDKPVSTDGLRTMSPAAAVNIVQHPNAGVDLDGFVMPSPVNAPPNPAGQLLTPVASPEQALQDLHRKRTSHSAQISNVAQEPPSARVRFNLSHQSPSSGYIPQQPSLPDQRMLGQPSLRNPNLQLIRRQPSLSRSMPCLPSTIASQSMPVSPRTITPNQRPHSRTPSHASTLSKGQLYLGILGKTMEDLSKYVKFDDTAKALRLPWLLHACQIDDLQFLLLNQMLCGATLNQNFTQQPEFGPSLVAGMQVMHLLFGPNEKLPKEFIGFLARWPNSVYALKTSTELRSWIALIATSLSLFGTRWNSFRLLCLRRQVPPSAQEIANAFQCNFSTLLPQAVFASISRQVTAELSKQDTNHHINIGAFQTAAFDMFAADLQNYNLLVGSSAGIPNAEQLQANFVAAYLRLCQQHFKPQGQPVNAVDGPQGLGSHSAINSAGPLTTQPLPPPAAMQSRESSNATIVQVPQYHVPIMRRPPLPSIGLRHGVPYSPQQDRRATVPPTTQAQTLASSGSSYVPSTNSPSNRTTRHPIGQQDRPAPPYLYGTVPNIISAEPPAAMTPPVQMNSGSVQQDSVRHQTAPDASNSRISVQPPAITQGNTPLLPSTQLNQTLLFLNSMPPREALHQGHLQEPLTVLSKDLPSTTARLYQFVDSLVIEPRFLTTKDPFFTAVFEMPDELFAKIARIQQHDDLLASPTRTISNDSVVVNLRCVQGPNTTEAISPATWAALPTHWPEHIFMAVNDQFLEVRRKKQHKRDLPVDITPLLRKGMNDLTVSYYADNTDSAKTYAIGCEIIVFRDATLVAQLPEQITAQDSLVSILQKMQAAEVDDDEMQVVTDSLVLSVADPFSSSLYETPVRGKTCLHRECFSLETFLQSRTSDNYDALTSVYQWLCPHCKRDARPCSLVVDGFMQEVCRKLVDAGEQDAKAIILKSDGSWTVRKEDDKVAQARPQRGTSVNCATKAENTISGKADTADPIDTANERTAGPSGVVDIIDLDND